MDAAARVKAIGLAAALIIGLLVTPAAAQPGLPGEPVATQLSADTVGVTFRLTWGLASGAVRYEYGAAYSDGSQLVMGTTVAPPVTFTIKYHENGLAQIGFVCVHGADAAGVFSTEWSCAPLSLPARPTTPPPPPPPSTSIQFDFKEPATNADGTPLTDLAEIRAYWRVDGGLETVTTYAPSSASGGGNRSGTLTVPATSGTLTLALTARDFTGNESVRTAVVTHVIGGGTVPEGATNLTIQLRQQ